MSLANEPMFQTCPMEFKCYIPNRADVTRFTALGGHVARLHVALVSPDTVEPRDRLPRLAGLSPARFFNGLPDEPPVYIFRPLCPLNNQGNQRQSLHSILGRPEPRHIWLAGGLGKTTAMLHALWERCFSDSQDGPSWIPCWLYTGPSDEDTFWYRLEDTLRVPDPPPECLAHSPQVTFFVDLDAVEGLTARARLVASIAGVALAHRYLQHRFVVAYRPRHSLKLG